MFRGVKDVSNQLCVEKQNIHFASYKILHHSDVYYTKVREGPGVVARCSPSDINELWGPGVA